EGAAAYTVDLLAGASDVDDNAVLHVAAVTYTVDGVATGNSGTDLPAGVSLSGATLSIDPTNGAYDHLAVGEHATIVVSYAVTDEHGATAAQSETITLTGTNDAPVVASALTTTAAEGAPAYTVDLLAGASDVDDNAVLHVAAVTYAVDGVATGNSGTDLPAGVSLSGATLSIDPTNGAYDHLAVGEHATIVVSYAVTDEHGATAAQSETITLTGTNDAPVVASALTTTAAEGAPAYTVDLLAGASDVDDNAVLHVAAVTYTVDGLPTGNGGTDLPAGVSLSGATLSIDPTNAAYDHLAVGEHATIVVSYAVTDEHGATAAQSETVTLTGTNDAPVVAAALTTTAAEGAAAYTVDLLADASDVDDNAVLHVAAVTYTVDGVATGNGGTDLPAGVSLSGATLSIDPTNAAYDHLAVGEHATIVVSYAVTDEHGATAAQTETVTLTGTNDAPVVAATLTTTAAEGAPAYTVDLLAGASDVDDNA